MPSNGLSASIPKGVSHVASDDADVVFWSNHRLRGGKDALIVAIGVNLVWLSVALWITDFAFFGSLPALPGGALILLAWSVQLILVNRLLTLAGKESIRVANNDITFTFAGIGRHRTIKVIRGELGSLTLGDRSNLQGLRCPGQRLLTCLAAQLSGRRPAVLLLAERMEQDEKAELYPALCEIFSKRNWRLVIQTGDDATSLCAQPSALPDGGN